MVAMCACINESERERDSASRHLTVSQALRIRFGPLHAILSQDCRANHCRYTSSIVSCKICETLDRTQHYPNLMIAIISDSMACIYVCGYTRIRSIPVTLVVFFGDHFLSESEYEMYVYWAPADLPHSLHDYGMQDPVSSMLDSFIAGQPSSERDG
eukprot:1822340-Amphidinium_carterae.1